MGTPKLLIRPGNPDFFDLPWELPVNDWEHERLVEMPTGIHRHPVVFVAYDEGVYAIKEMPTRLAVNEYEILHALREVSNRVANPAGLVILQRPELSAEVKFTRFNNTINAFSNSVTDGFSNTVDSRDFDDSVVTPSFFSFVYPTERLVVAAFVRELMATLLRLAEGHRDWPLPGYTHLQRAQPVSLAHHLLAYFWMFSRDAGRFAFALESAAQHARVDRAMSSAPYYSRGYNPTVRALEVKLASLEGVRIRRSVGEVKAIAFSLAFVTTHKEVAAVAKAVAKKTDGDAIVWLAYPKKSSRRPGALPMRWAAKSMRS